MTFVDAHVHFWDPRRLRYPWLETVPALNRPLLLEDYRAACGRFRVSAFYFVQAECLPEQALDELAFVSELARQDPRLLGIVPYAPLHLGDAACPYLDLLAKNPLVKGVRRMIKSEPHLDFCIRPKFIEGVRALAGYNFSFALGITHKHILNSARLAEACPNVRFVVDHFAQPDIRNHHRDPSGFERWRHDIRRISQLPNVWCKMSSLATEANHLAWTLNDLRPYLDHVIECWGFSRTMFATDWPVSAQAATIPQTMEILQLLYELPSTMMRDTALNFYADRLP